MLHGTYIDAAICEVVWRKNPSPPPPSSSTRGGFGFLRCLDSGSMRLEVVKHEEAKRGFILLPRRWVGERDFAWTSRFRRLAKDYERLPATLAGLHFVAFACLFLRQATGILGAGP